MRPDYLSMTRHPPASMGGATVGADAGYAATFLGAVLLVPAIGGALGYFYGRTIGHPVAGLVAGAVLAEIGTRAWYQHTQGNPTAGASSPRAGEPLNPKTGQPYTDDELLALSNSINPATGTWYSYDDLVSLGFGPRIEAMIQAGAEQAMANAKAQQR